MSYIRSGSNPEKLYIVGTRANVEIMESHKEAWYIPYNVFHGLLKKFDRMFRDFPCEFKGAKVDEVWVDENNNEKDDLLYIPSLNHPFNCKVKLTYEEHSLYMWEVTWEHILNGYLDRVRRSTTHKVYVQWDPLFERVLCAHEKPNKKCRICEAAEKDTGGYHRGTYQIEEIGLRIRTEDKLDPK